jgi:predicted signal transduction protein with EAL and GGDEF domain
MNVVAEGIETVHQLHQLRILNCEYGQGFLFSRAVPLPEADLMVDDRSRWQKIMPPANQVKPPENKPPIQIGITQ